MYPDSEILFPPSCIKSLRGLRGDQWHELIDHILTLPNNHEEVLAFGLLIIDESSCLTCSLDSYRASLGCCTCAQRSISGYKGNDEELLADYQKHLAQVRKYISNPKISFSTEIMLKATPIQPRHR
ncbi:MAG: hypothetical protein U9Q70_11910 [Chloroflexota bacterium]|nr:hypothetical protein [Chloroflexota bacterium]